jgi:uncharacterized membrane protein
MAAAMGKGRLEAFSDGVLAIIITVMVLGLPAPQGTDLAALLKLAPSLLSYVLSFIYAGIYWNNHHHMLQATRQVSGAVLWANLGLLFWLSLLPFATGWMGQNHAAALPAAVYGFILLMAALAYALLQHCIIAAEGKSASLLAQAVGKDWKGKASPLLYALGIALALANWVWAAQAVFTAVALMWLIPDRRIERQMQ